MTSRGQFGREGLLEGDVAGGEASAGLEDAGDLAEDGGLVGGEVDDAIGDDAIDGGGGEGHVVDGGEVELDVGEGDAVDAVACGCGGAGDHGGGHVDADGLASGADFAGGEEDVEAAAGAEVDDGFAGFEAGQRKWGCRRRGPCWPRRGWRRVRRRCIRRLRRRPGRPGVGW